MVIRASSLGKCKMHCTGIIKHKTSQTSNYKSTTSHYFSFQLLQKYNYFLFHQFKIEKTTSTTFNFPLYTVLQQFCFFENLQEVVYVFFNALCVFECTTYKISSKTQLSSYLQSLIPFAEKTASTTIKNLFIHLG